MRHTLRYKHHDFDLPEGEFTIGRAETCQLSLDDPLVSRHHARLRVTESSISLEDLGSRNGVRVNGERIDAPRLLVAGDQIMIGSQEMVLIERREAAADTLVQVPSQRGNVFGLLGMLADKALGLGRGEEAERLIGQQLDQLLIEIEGGRPIEASDLARAADYALRLAAATGQARWVDYIFRAYSAARRPCAVEIADQLYTITRRVKNPNLSELRAYLAVLRQLELAPAERFLLSRLEGLERLMSAR